MYYCTTNTFSTYLPSHTFTLYLFSHNLNTPFQYTQVLNDWWHAAMDSYATNPIKVTHSCNLTTHMHSQSNAAMYFIDLLTSRVTVLTEALLIHTLIIPSCRIHPLNIPTHHLNLLTHSFNLPPYLPTYLPTYLPISSY